MPQPRKGRPQRHPNSGDLYTPITPELLEMLIRMRDELGSWRELAALSGHRIRMVRRIYRVEVKVVSQTLLDTLCVASGVGSIREFTWFTADDLVQLGVWRPIELYDAAEMERRHLINVEKARVKGELKAKKERAEKRRQRKIRRARGW